MPLIHKLAKKTVYKLVDENIISEDDHEIYEYGAQIFFATILSFLGVIGIGVVAKEILWSILFLLSYCSIRYYTGGYHADSFRKCICSFWIIFLSGLFINSTFHLFLSLSSFALVLTSSNIFTFLFAPVEALNNKLPVERKRLMKKRAFLIINFWLILLFILQLNQSDLRGSIYWALFSLDFLLLLGNMKNRKELKRHENE